MSDKDKNVISLTATGMHGINTVNASVIGDKRLRGLRLVIDPNEYSEVECAVVNPFIRTKREFNLLDLPKELRDRADELTKDIFKHLESQR